MSHTLPHISYTPAATEQLMRMSAEMIVAEARKECGGSFKKLSFLPISAAAHMLNISVRKAASVLPVTNTGLKERSISLYHLEQYTESNTTYPKA